MTSKLNLKIGGAYRDNQGNRIELNSLYHELNEGLRVFNAPEFGLWREDGIAVNRFRGNLLTPNPRIYLVTEILENGDEASLPLAEPDHVSFQFREPQRFLSNADIQNIAQLTNQLEMIANRVGLEVRVELHPLKETS